MNFEFFTARRIIASKDHKSSVSAPIIKIAITAIAMGVVIMLVSIAVTLGLQQKIRENVKGPSGLCNNVQTICAYIETPNRSRVFEIHFSS